MTGRTSRTSPLYLLAVSAVLAGAALVRYRGLTFGFPLLVHPDEANVMDGAMRIVESGSLNPGTLLYPSLLIYANAIVLGVIQSLGSLLLEYEPTELDAYYIGRLVTVGFAIATVYVVARIGSRAISPPAGLVAAAITGSSLLHFSHSISVTTDVPMAFWTTATVGAVLWLQAAPAATWRAYALAGALVGAAVGTKYNAFPVAVAVATAHLLRPQGPKKSLVEHVRPLATAGCCSAAAFFLTTP